MGAREGTVIGANRFESAVFQNRLEYDLDQESLDSHLVVENQNSKSNVTFASLRGGKDVVLVSQPRSGGEPVAKKFNLRIPLFFESKLNVHDMAAKALDWDQDGDEDIVIGYAASPMFSDLYSNNQKIGVLFFENQGDGNFIRHAFNRENPSGMINRSANYLYRGDDKSQRKYPVQFDDLQFSQGADGELTLSHTLFQVDRLGNKIDQGEDYYDVDYIEGEMRAMDITGFDLVEHMAITMSSF